MMCKKGKNFRKISILFLCQALDAGEVYKCKKLSLI